MNKPVGISTVSIFALLLLWGFAARLTDDAQILPSPIMLLRPLADEIASGALPYHLGHTLLRVFLAFILAMAIGVVLGLLMGRSGQVDRWLDPWLVVFLNLPALVLIVLCYLWIGLNETAAIIAVTLSKVPGVAVTIREGARALSVELDAMAQVYRMPLTRRLRHVILPQLAPFIAAASRSGVAVIWKVVLVAEFLGRSNGIGFQIHLYFQLFDVGMVLVYALSFVVVMLAVEWGLLQPLERRTRRWRSA